MRFRTVLSLATLFVFCFSLAAWSIPLPALPVASHLRSAPDNQSASGKISSVGDAAFSLEVLKDQDVNTIQFLVDGNTKVEGKLRSALKPRSNTVRTVAKTSLSTSSFRSPRESVRTNRRYRALEEQVTTSHKRIANERPPNPASTARLHTKIC